MAEDLQIESGCWPSNRRAVPLWGRGGFEGENWAFCLCLVLSFPRGHVVDDTAMCALRSQGCGDAAFHPTAVFPEELGASPACLHGDSRPRAQEVLQEPGWWSVQRGAREDEGLDLRPCPLGGRSLQLCEHFSKCSV